MNNLHSLLRSLSLLALLFFAPGCQLSEKAISVFNEHIGPVFGVRLEPLKQIAAKESAPELKESDHKRINMEFLKEIHSVILDREPNVDEYTKWMNVLDQSGSYEGIYNGLINGEEYASKEKGAAPVGALKIYAEIMTRIALDMKYDPLKIQAAKAEAEMLGISNQTVEPSSAQPSDEEKKSLYDEFSQKGLNKSTLTLRREAGHEALRMIELKRDYREKFATWYGRFVTYTNSKNIDFGIEGRNKGDEYYHYKWALENSEDRVKWEVLNRIHRLFKAQI